MFKLFGRILSSKEGSWEPYHTSEPVDIGANEVATGLVMRKVTASGIAYRAMTAEEKIDFEYWQAVK